MAEIGELVSISEHLLIKRISGGVVINKRGRTVVIDHAELSALLAALEKAAGEMGIVTPTAELVKACKAALDEYARVVLAEYGYAWETPAIKAAKQALARAER